MIPTSKKTASSLTELQRAYGSNTINQYDLKSSINGIIQNGNYDQNDMTAFIKNRNMDGDFDMNDVNYYLNMMKYPQVTANAVGVVDNSQVAVDNATNKSNEAYDELMKKYQESQDAYDNSLAEYRNQIGSLYKQGYDATGSMLDKNYDLQTEDLLRQYRYALDQQEQQKKSGMHSAAYQYRQMLKYLPLMQKMNGLGKLGTSASDVLDANADYMNQRGAVNSSYNTNMASLANAYGTNKTSLDTNYNKDKADNESAYTGNLAGNAQHYGDLSAYSQKETGDKIAEAGLEKYSSAASIAEQYRQEQRTDAIRAEQWAREDKQLADAAEKQSQEEFEEYLLDMNSGYIQSKIYEITNDGKVSQSDYDALYSLAMKYYDRLSENGKLTLTNMLEQTKADIDIPVSDESKTKMEKAQNDETAAHFMYKKANGDNGYLTEFMARKSDENGIDKVDDEVGAMFEIVGPDGTVYCMTRGEKATDSVRNVLNHDYMDITGNKKVTSGAMVIYRDVLYVFINGAWTSVNSRYGYGDGYANGDGDKLSNVLGVNIPNPTSGTNGASNKKQVTNQNLNYELDKLYGNDLME